MDPSCGYCLGGSCNGSPPWTDPNCPEHGINQSNNVREGARFAPLPPSKAKIRGRRQAGHTDDCKMNGCESIPKCKVEALIKKLEADVLRISDEHHRKLLADLRRRGIA